MEMPSWMRVALPWVNAVILAGLLLIGADWWVRERAREAMLTYHNQVIAPLIQRPAPPVPPTPPSTR